MIEGKRRRETLTAEPGMEQKQQEKSGTVGGEWIGQDQEMNIEEEMRQVWSEENVGAAPVNKDK